MLEIVVPSSFSGTHSFCDFCRVWLFSLPGSSPGGSRRCRAASKEVPRGQGKPKAPERWLESSGRGLDDDFLFEAFSCQVWSFSVLLGRLQVSQGGVELRPRRSVEFRESHELQMGGLRALEEAWKMTFRLRHASVKFGRFLCFTRCRAAEGSGPTGSFGCRLEASG